jgi:hypothetical protein
LPAVGSASGTAYLRVSLTAEENRTLALDNHNI